MSLTLAFIGSIESIVDQRFAANNVMNDVIWEGMGYLGAKDALNLKTNNYCKLIVRLCEHEDKKHWQKRFGVKSKLETNTKPRTI